MARTGAPSPAALEDQLKAGAFDLCQLSSEQGEGFLQLLPKTEGKHCWTGCSPVLVYLLYGCSMEEKTFP